MTIKKEELRNKDPKQLRTLRNQLNNRLKSFEEELKFGKKVGKLSPSHNLFDLNMLDCQKLLVEVKSLLRDVKFAGNEDE